MKNKLLKIGLTAVALTAGLGLVACSPETEGQKAFTAEVFDIYVKLGDEAFDYSSNLPEGVTVDVSKVNESQVGEYTITYKQNGVTLDKTAFVCGEPTISHVSGTLEMAKEVTYAWANEMDFMDAETCGLVAKDSFGNTLKITAQADEYYIGNYGEYTVQYKAVDYAGNEKAIAIVYTVSGANAPSATLSTPDVIDEQVNVTVTLTQAELDSMFVYINGEYAEKASYQATETGVSFAVENFLADLQAGVTEHIIRLETKEWYLELPTNFTDEKTPVFEELSFDKWVFVENQEITLSAPQKLKPQEFEIVYSLTSENGVTVSVDEAGKILTIEKENGIVGKGRYTVTAEALRGGEVQATKSATITVYTKEEFEKVLLPLNSTQFDGELFAKFSALVDFSYDEEMGAYKMFTDAPVVDGNSGDTLIFDPAGQAYQKFLSGFQKYHYLALDICFIEPPETGGTVVLYLQDRTGYPFQHTRNATSVAVYDEATGKRMDKANLQAGVWYTYYCDAYAFDERVHTNSGTPLIGRQVKEALGYAGAYYLRNVRFVDEEFGGGRAGDNYSVQVGKSYTLPTFGQATPQYMVTPSEGVSVNGNSVKVLAAGEYTATLGERTLHFTAYTAEEYENIVANMTCQQFEGQFYGFASTNKPHVLISFDEQAKAYKFLNDPNSPAGANQVRVTKNSEMYNKLMAANGKNKYLVFEIKFEIAPSGTNRNMLFYFNKEANATTKVNQTLTTDGVKIYKSGTTATATRATIVAGEWYDVYVPMGTFAENGTLIGMQGVLDGAYWIRNIRLSTTA